MHNNKLMVCGSRGVFWLITCWCTTDSVDSSKWKKTGEFFGDYQKELCLYPNVCVWVNTWNWWYTDNAGKFHLWDSNKRSPYMKSTHSWLVLEWFIQKVQSEFCIWSMAKDIFLWTIITKLSMDHSEETVLLARWRSETQSIEYKAWILRTKLKIDLQPRSECQYYKTITSKFVGVYSQWMWQMFLPNKK